MAGPFDFDNAEPPPDKRRDDRDQAPAPKKRHEGRDDREQREDEEEPPRPRRAYTEAGRRATSLGRVSFSIGAFVMIGGGLLALVALVLPGMNTYPFSDQPPHVTPVRGLREGERVVWWAFGAIAAGVFSMRVRAIRYPAASDYLMSVGKGGLGLVPAGLLVLAGLALIGGTRSYGAMRQGYGVYVVPLAGLVVAAGALGRFVERVLKMGKAGEPVADDRRRRERDEAEPKPRRRPERDEDDEPPRRKRREDGDEADDDDEPPPKPRPRAKRPRDEDDE